MEETVFQPVTVIVRLRPIRWTLPRVFPTSRPRGHFRPGWFCKTSLDRSL